MKRWTTVLLAVGLLAMPALAGAIQITFDVSGGIVDTTFDGSGTWTINSISNLLIYQIVAFETPYDGTYSSEGGDPYFSNLFLNYDGTNIFTTGAFFGIDPIAEIPNTLFWPGEKSILTAAVGPWTFGADDVAGGLLTKSGSDTKDADFLALFSLSSATNPWGFQLAFDLIDNFDGTFAIDQGQFNNFYPPPQDPGVPVPEAGAATLLVTGMIGLTWFRRKKRFRD